jgi:hypothetical protein
VRFDVSGRLDAGCLRPTDGTGALSALDYSAKRRSPLGKVCLRRHAASDAPGAGIAAGWSNLRSRALNVHLGLTPIISLLAGILILVVPRLLNFIVAIYLIVIGLIGLFGAGQLHLG